MFDTLFCFMSGAVMASCPTHKTVAMTRLRLEQQNKEMSKQLPIDRYVEWHTQLSSRLSLSLTHRQLVLWISLLVLLDMTCLFQFGMSANIAKLSWGLAVLAKWFCSMKRLPTRYWSCLTYLRIHDCKWWNCASSFVFKDELAIH